MAGVRRLPFGSGAVRSLRWEGDALVDDVRGAMRLEPDGMVVPARFFWGFGFDAAIRSPGGRSGAVYSRLGTKAVLTLDGRVVGELNRTFYCADVYDYAICVFTLADGREVVAHCPESYDRIELQDVETGALVARIPEGEAADVFHSRLRASPDGRRLLSAGWVWHPYGVICVYDVVRGRELFPYYERIDAEVEDACWLSDDLIAVAASSEEPLDGDDPARLTPGELGVLSLSRGAWVSRVLPRARMGTLHPFGDHLLALYEHPKLVDPATGEVVAAWREIATGTQDSSITRGKAIPAVAVDAAGGRFAVADGEDVVVVEVR